MSPNIIIILRDISEGIKNVIWWCCSGIQTRVLVGSQALRGDFSVSPRASRG